MTEVKPKVGKGKVGYAVRIEEKPCPGVHAGSPQSWPSGNI